MTSLIPALAVAALAGIYWFPLRQWFVRWGALTGDLTRLMPGDPLVARPYYKATLGITIAARPEHVWPWLVQMGYRRGGLYSYDWLDRLFGYLDAPSADVILPQFQRLSVGDEIPIGRAGGFPVTAIDRHRSLVLSGNAADVTWVWQFGLYQTGDNQTRLVSRNLVAAPRSLRTWILMRAIEPAAFLMTRRMLKGLRQRAEHLTTRDRTALTLAA